MSETLHLEGLAFAVRRSVRRSTVGVAVERDGSLTVSAPSGADLNGVEQAVRARLFWVFTKLAEKALLFQPAPEKEYVSGEGFCYLGRSYRLQLTDGTTEGAPLILRNGRFVLRKADRHRAGELFADWYTEHGRAWISQRVSDLAPRVGVEVSSVRVRDLGNRWGSCSPDGGLNFHWRTIRLPPSLVEYVAAHELVHLLEPKHDANFWTRLERLLPDSAARKHRLAETGGRY
jgi:predicted metal-dependent hydrolase